MAVNVTESKGQRPRRITAENHDDIQQDQQICKERIFVVPISVIPSLQDHLTFEMLIFVGLIYADPTLS